MIAIFNTEKDAIVFSDKVHNFLLVNRKGYNAEKWAEPNKSDTEEKYFVKVPSDFEKWPIKLSVINEVKVTKLPITWRSITEVKPIIKQL